MERENFNVFSVKNTLVRWDPTVNPDVLCCQVTQFVVKCLSLVADHRYRKTSDISRTLAGTKIIDQSDVVGALPVGAAPTTSSFST